MMESLSTGIYTSNQLEQLGQVLASRHRIHHTLGVNSLLKRLQQNEDILRTTYKLVTSTLQSGHKPTPAAEWLLDNFHIIEEQVRTAKLHLPASFCKELPTVDDPKFKRQPRIYLIAREFINHTDGRLDSDSISRIMKSYQSQSELKLGELWAFPIMLRLALIDNIRIIAESLASHHVDQSNAKFWAEKLNKIDSSDPRNMIRAVAEFESSEPRLSSAFVSELSRRMQALSNSPSLPLSWIEVRIAEQGSSLENIQNLASQDQAHDQMSISNSFTSLRFLNETDWRSFVESLSEVNAILRRDPSKVFDTMDFSTRDSYRHSVETIARYSKRDEIAVAKAAIDLSKNQSRSDAAYTLQNHVGYHLVGAGCGEFEKLMGVKFTLSSRIRKGLQGRPFLYYSSFILLVSTLLLIVPFQMIWHLNIRALIAIPLMLTLLFPASQCGIAIVNWFTLALIKPKPWSRLDFSKGIPFSSKTLVAVPCMLTTANSIRTLVEDLEVRYLGNRDTNIMFALVSDFTDSASESSKEDIILLDFARDSISALNIKYELSDERRPFYLFHRNRTWNESESIWMGYERKRGKLTQLNEYLRGGAIDAFNAPTGDLYNLHNTTYILTLDADSTLPRETACRLIETMTHPLNRPVYDELSGLVKSGYAVLQPRIAVHLGKSNISHFTRLFSDDFGIDPYTKSVSDVYQDLFHEGSFVGKGLYDIDAFQSALKSRFPDNRVLSHDLIESGFARSGLVSDITLVEEYPSNYSSDASRRHRWIRGDWQIAAWLLPKIPDSRGTKTANPLSILSRWKIFDNLRRSLTPVACLLIFFLSWNAGYTLSLGMLTTLMVYLALPYCLRVFRIQSEFVGKIAFGQVMHDELILLARAFIMSLLTIILLPYEAFLSIDAGLRSFYRLSISKKRLLEWRSSAEDNAKGEGSVLSYTKLMWVCPIMAAVMFSFVYSRSGSSSTVAVPILIGWFFAPSIAWWMSRPVQKVEQKLSDKETDFLRMLSRKSWHFFDTFLTAEDNWLPPDNFQEYPVAVVAHRTSPTNIGLSLLAGLGAYDFGYISLTRLINLTENTLKTLGNMERNRGHFYNWYDTKTLRPLLPLYISTVDSGNLHGCLLVLAQGLEDLAEGECFPIRLIDGLEDSVLVLRSTLSNQIDSDSRCHSMIGDFREKIRKMKNHSNRDALSQAEFVKEANAFLTADAEWASLSVEGLEWLAQIRKQIQDHQNNPCPLQDGISAAVKENLRALASYAREFMKKDYAFLYNKSNKLLSIGYNVADARLDQSYYDLLASEARLASFLAIADGTLPQEHWFALGRQLTYSGRSSTLMSWSGSMFEYLMPLLIMPSDEKTLIHEACKQCIRIQIDYGKSRKVPWGISESAYNLTDSHYNYQYRAFGVPGLGFKRGLEHDLVVAPYATVMALMLEPEAACSNLQDLAALGFIGKYGFYEAIDYTPSRIPAGENHALIRSYMAHHQGMSFLSLLYQLLDKPMQKRMAKNPMFKATELLLHERVPKKTSHIPEVNIGKELTYPDQSFEESFRVIKNPSRATPEAHLLGNGTYNVMMTSAGSGYSSWKGILLTRWREDRSKDDNGYYIYIQDVKSRDSWSAGFQPTLKEADQYEAIFSEGRAEIRRSENELTTHLEVAVSPDDDVELRRLTISNHSSDTKVLEITTFAEVVLTSLASDQAHPSFSNLFIESEILPQQEGIICKRRNREPQELHPLLYHTMYVHGCKSNEASFETDRAKFIGRNRDRSSPVSQEASLSNSSGAVLDPSISIRKRISIKPGATAIVDCILGMHNDRASALMLMERFGEKIIADRILELAWTHGHVLLQQINCSASEALLYGKMAGSLIYGGSKLRAQVATIKANSRPLSSLWSYGISGDYPIVLLRLFSQDSSQILQQTLRGHDYWHRKGLIVDLVIWNEDRSGYRQDLNERIVETIASSSSASLLDKHGGIFVRRPDQMPDEDRILFQAAARIIISDQAGSLEEQVNTRSPASVALPKPIAQPSSAKKRVSSHEIGEDSPSACPLEFDNGLGGFSQDGREYVVKISRLRKSPMPWVNVLANPNFGTLVSESGSSYTWSENAHEHRLTPWFNDSIVDPSGEVLYLRDETTGEFWTPTPSPCPGERSYETKHGFGYTSFETESKGIRSLMTTFVATSDPIKIIMFKLSNKTNRRRCLSLTAYFELVLGEHRSKSASQILSEYDKVQNILSGRNLFASDFRNRIAFVSATEQASSVTGNRTEFVGRNGSLRFPAALDREQLSGQIGVLHDPCLAMQLNFEIPPGETLELAFLFGLGRDLADARRLSRAYRSISQIQLAFDAVHHNWTRLLSRTSLHTPDQALNVLANGWLMYQTLSSRVWGRTGFYQSGGAYGFRDQLQDMMAVIYSAPEIVREHIVRCSGRQFLEGDVQHWWHPPLGRGVRTRISDDYLWLPFVTQHYIKVTGDRTILDEQAHYLTSKTLPDGVESEYGLPLVAEETGSVYEHCVKALQYGFRFGSHGLPLMGSGDWNDGMNHVGIDGKGESVWLAFFLYDCLTKFAELAKSEGDLDFALKCIGHSTELKKSIEDNAWDGSWYKRAYFDDGSPLGVSENQECRIDSLPQSWAILSGADTETRGMQGLHAAYEQLVDKDHGIIKLFAPPFNRQLPNPGYISGYLPGVRENGGQYTHAAIWMIMAFAKGGEVDRALELLNLINPVRLGATPEGSARYKIESYVIAGDVYAATGHGGRGGWSWYTGSSAWFYRAIIEVFVGFEILGDKVMFTPRLPKAWPSMRFDFCYLSTKYEVNVRRKSGIQEIAGMMLDGKAIIGLIQLADDRVKHYIEVVI